MKPIQALILVLFFPLGLFKRFPKREVRLREKEILLLLTNGNSYKMIAADLEISIETVKTHMKKIYKKLHVNSQSEAVSKAIRDRLV